LSFGTTNQPAGIFVRSDVNVLAGCVVVNSQILVQWGWCEVELCGEWKWCECAEQHNWSGFSGIVVFVWVNRSEIVGVLGGRLSTCQAQEMQRAAVRCQPSAVSKN
jgi:hypothetical protein